MTEVLAAKGVVAIYQDRYRQADQQRRFEMAQAVEQWVMEVPGERQQQGGDEDAGERGGKVAGL